MTFRVRFAKYGVVRFIGHLDVMRYFQKVIRRSELPVKYSQGFNPHQLLSFAQPLGVGITSDGEYMEIEFDDTKMIELAGIEACGSLDIGNGVVIPLTRPEDAPALEKIIFDGMSAETYEGFEILEVVLLPPPKPNTRIEKAMSLVSAADYLISLRDGYDMGCADEAEFLSEWERFLGSEHIFVTKKTKKTETELDLKQYILLAGGIEKGGIRYIGDIGGGRFDPRGIAHAESYDNGQNVMLRLTAGSTVNIRPELVLEAFCGFADREYNENAFRLHRMETYLGEMYGK